MTIIAWTLPDPEGERLCAGSRLCSPWWSTWGPLTFFCQITDPGVVSCCLAASWCFYLSRELGQVQPGAHHSDVHLCGCNPLLAPVNAFYPKTEKGKNISDEILCSFWQKSATRPRGTAGVVASCLLPQMPDVQSRPWTGEHARWIIIPSLRTSFPVCLAVKTPRFHCRGQGFNPWPGNEDPTCLMAKKKKIQKTNISP